ncbi:bifunctional riboflavin kinase/FAD synthetase [candidate division KSB1 bacterium]|nr:bifunctional riboflavin kinase/FAD synthetase [candidate division KSB1 bacterium]
MKIVRSLNEIHNDSLSCVSLGTFDGVHLGHQALIHALTLKAKQENGRSVLLTFEPYPQTVLKGSQTIRLTTEEEKIVQLDQTGLDLLFVIPFTLELACMLPEEFIQKYMIKKIGLSWLFAGFNHAFGKDKEGTRDFLQTLADNHGFHLKIVEPVYKDDLLVSSSQIRSLLNEGNVRHASQLLGRNYQLSGRVVRGRQVGEKLGFPTANLEVEHPDKVIPADGVYAVQAVLAQEQFSGTCNIGFAPTIKDEKREIEIYLHNYTGDLYGKHLTIQFVDRLRDEIKFNSVDELIHQMKIDKQNSERILLQSL